MNVKCTEDYPAIYEKQIEQGVLSKRLDVKMKEMKEEKLKADEEKRLIEIQRKR